MPDDTEFSSPSETQATPSTGDSTSPASSSSTQSIPASGTTTAQAFNADAADDSAIDALIAGKGRDGASKAYEAAGKPTATNDKTKEIPGDSAPDGKPEESDPAATKPAGDEQPEAFKPSDEQANLLRRNGLKPDSAWIASMPAAERENFLSNLAERTAFTDSLVQQARGSDPNRPGAPATKPTGAQSPAVPDDVLKPLNDYFGPDVTKQIVNVAGVLAQQQSQQLQAQLSEVRQGQDAYYSHLIQTHTDSGWDAVAKSSPPPGVKLDDTAVRDAVMRKASQLLEAKTREEGFNPHKYNLQHAIPEAFQLIHKQDIQKAERVRLADRQRKAIERSPDGGGRSSSSSPKRTQEEIDDAVYDAITAGKTREEAMQIAAG